MRLVLGLLLVLTCLVPGLARGDELEIPGLSADSGAYASALRQRFPAGATARQRADAEARAQSAETRKDWAAAVSAWSDRLGQGETTPGFWLAFAHDLLNQIKSDPAHALAAAWQAFEASRTGADQVPALLVMRDALAALGRPVPEIEVLEAASDRAPDDADLRRQLTLRKQQLGLLVRKVRTEPESFPTRACIAFIGRPGGAADFHADDWVRLDPKVPDAAVTLELGEVCISGLRPGATTRVNLLAGMPGADGVSLKAPETLAVAMPDRQPRLVFDGALFLQPSGAPPQVALASVNLSAVKLDLVRVTERAAQPFLAAHPPGDELADTDLDGLRQSGELVWTGRADIPGFVRNDLLHTRLPLPPAALDRPGLYLLLARTGDGTPRTDGGGPQAVQMVLRTDLAPTAWQGGDGLSVQVRGYADAQPKAGVQVALIASDNDVLATEATGADGVAHFAPALLHGEAGTAPAALHLAEGGWQRLHRAQPDTARLRPRRPRCVRPGAAGVARRLRLARPRHLQTRRDGAGDGAPARCCRAPGGGAGPRDRQAAGRPGLRRHRAEARRGRLDLRADRAVGRCAGRDVEHRAANDEGRAGGRSRQLPGGGVRARAARGGAGQACGAAAAGADESSFRSMCGFSTGRRAPG